MSAVDGADILRRISANFRDPTARDLGSSVTQRDTAVYCDPERFQAELNILFRKRPLIVAHVSEVAHPGDFITTEIAGMPVLVTRDDAGKIRAMVNVCLHRAAKVEPAECGERRHFVCPYHAWAYGRDGQLSYITDADSFTGAGLEGKGLKQLAVTERHGLIFVQIDADDDEALGLNLGGMGEEFDDFDLSSHICFRSRRIELDFNWKLAIDGALESYHLNYLHPSTAIFSGLVSPIDFYGLNGEHSRFCVGRKAVRKMGQDELVQENLRNNTMIAYNLFPNGNITVPHDHIVMQYYMPTAVNRSFVVYKLLVPQGTRESHFDHWEKTWEMLAGIMDEDYSMSTEVQKTFAAGYSSPLIFGRYEQAVARFHENCDRELSAAHSS